MARRYALRDDQWERIKDFLPGREGHVGGTAKDNRLFIEAVLYRYRAGLRGETYRSGSEISGSSIRATHAGAHAASGKRFSSIWPKTPTTNTR